MDVGCSSRLVLGRVATLAVCVALAGCQQFNRPPATDPFIQAQKPATPDPAATPAQQQGVVPASFDQQAYDARAQQASAVPGVSLGDAPNALEQKSWWEKTSESLKPTNLSSTALKAIGMGPDEKLARAKLAEGNDLFLKKEFANAVKAYHTAAFRWPDSTLEEDAMFLEAESLFFSDQYNKAYDAYSGLLKKYENSRYLDKAVQRLFAIGVYWEQKGEKVLNYAPNFIDKTRPTFDTRGYSTTAFEGIRLQDPTGPLADDAVKRVADHNFLRGRYEDAAYNYDMIRKEYPHSEHYMESQLLGLQSKMLSYQGPQYDHRPLEEADKLCRDTLAQVSPTQTAERERLTAAQAKIRNQLAERDWDNGEYYYRRKYYGAARHFYLMIVRDYADTQYGPQAQQRLDETKDLPPQPTQYFNWVGRIFGERDRTQR